jgi:anion-transporting  ArsA/GET3 family ATPase
VSAADFGTRILERSRITVCVGCGGAGKTTIAAAIALEAARRGRNVAVLTIDPARRLADALGVRALGNEPQEIPRSTLEALGVSGDGKLSAMMLDMKRTFDDMVERFAENSEARDRVLENPIYRHLSDALAGSVEFSAMEKVFELCEREEYDLVIVDTPPAAHALDFLEAPQRMVEFLESRIVQMLIHPAMAAGRFGFKIFQRGARRMLHLLERVSGIGFLEDVSEFLMAFEHMSEGFRDRALKVRERLLGPEASFVLVAGPAKQSALQAEQFLDRLEATGVPLAGVLVNRVRHWPGGALPETLASDREIDPADLAALATAFRDSEGPDFPAETAARAAVLAATGYADLVRRDLGVTAALMERTRGRGRHWGTIAELSHDVHDLDGLAKVADMIFRPPEEAAADGNPNPNPPRDRAG